MTALQSYPVRRLDQQSFAFAGLVVMNDFLNWLAGLPSGVATFLGTLTGSSIGLIAILIGALFNAHLNRKRDDRLRAEDRIALVSAMKAELRSIEHTLTENANDLTDKKRAPADFMVPDPAHSIRIFPEVVAKLGLLEPKTIRAVTEAYLLLAQYAEALIMLDGRLIDMPGDRRVFMMSSRRAQIVADINRKRAEKINEAIAALDKWLPKELRGI